MEGLDKVKSAMIITTREQEISDALSEAFKRGITHIDAKRYCAGREQTVIYFVVNRFQIARMKDIVSEIDSQVFVTITEVSDMIGSSLKERYEGRCA